MTNKKGGARAGAGRPSEFGERKQTGSVCLTPEVWHELTRMAQAEGLSRNAWLEKFLRLRAGLNVSTQWEQLIERHRKLAISRRRADRAVESALAESLKPEEIKAAYERCLQSVRFPTLVSLVNSTPCDSEFWPQVVAFAKLLAENPRI